MRLPEVKGMIGGIDIYLVFGLGGLFLWLIVGTARIDKQIRELRKMEDEIEILAREISQYDDRLNENL